MGSVLGHILVRLEMGLRHSCCSIGRGLSTQYQDERPVKDVELASIQIEVPRRWKSVR